ncbi:MAG: hypothetical protein LRS48_00985 [Desulfurococcales archaeon]|nr:hypothetical protein [Desulfurococcales archaeon]
MLAADSRGVRSLAVLVEACGYTIGIDLGVSIAPRRYGLPPHESELRRLEESMDRVRSAIRESDIIIVTHYHYDHYVRDEPELYKGKILIVKDPKHNINRSQAIRSYVWLKKLGVEEAAREVLIADGNEYRFPGGLKLAFSPPVWHGYPGTKVGRVVMVRLECGGESLIYTSDVQGPADPDALETLRSWSSLGRPMLAIVDGPPTYFAGFKVPRSHVEAGLKGMEELAKILKPEVIIVDHHLVRDKDYRKYLASLAGEAPTVKVLTGAEYMGEPVEPLEAWRRELWRGEDPARWQD